MELVDWSVAGRVGRAVAGSGVRVSPAAAAEVAGHFEDAVRDADRLVREFTGLEPAQAAGQTLVLGRGAWVDANLDAIRALVRPVGERLRGRPRRVTGVGLGLQIGVLIGYIAQKVLGQYDLLLATGEPGRVLFVGPNILAAERRHGLDPRDFRLWIALHEVTHRTQFLAVPWLREHVKALVARYLAGATVDAERIREVAARVRDIVAGGPEAWRRVNVMSVFLTTDQLEAVEAMQALMTVVEGHGNFVMDRVAAREIPSYRRLREALQSQRGSAGPAERAFQRLVALDLKYEQYAVGQAFFDAVAERGGIDAVNRVWDARGNLPSRDELRDPDSWLRRVAPQPSLFDRPSPGA